MWWSSASTSKPDRLRHLLSWVGAVVVVVATWSLLIFRIVPGLRSDRAIFITVAEFLLHGQTLYAEVWDQKEPLFYWLLALSRIGSPHGDLVLEAAYVLGAGLAALAIARFAAVPLSVALVLGLVTVPVLLTGLGYYRGYTTVPGVSVALIVVALTLRQRWFAAGLVASLLVFLKAPLAPLGLAAVALGWWLLAPAPRDRAASLVLTGGGLGGAVMLLALAWRGELLTWLAVLGNNADYAATTAGAGGQVPVAPWWHLSTAVHFPGFWPFLALVVLLGLVLVMPVARQVLRESGPVRFLAGYVVVSALLSLMVLAATGLWPHHALILAVPAVTGVAAATITTHRRLGELGSVVVLALLAATWMLTTVWLQSARTYSPDRGMALLRHDPVTAEAAALLTVAETGDFARVGSNGNPSAGYGIPGWRLACPHFQQYGFTPAVVLDETLACLSTVDVLLVSNGMTAQSPDSYRDFVLAVQAMVERDFRCARYPGGRVCVRPGSGFTLPRAQDAMSGSTASPLVAA